MDDEDAMFGSAGGSRASWRNASPAASFTTGGRKLSFTQASSRSKSGWPWKRDPQVTPAPALPSSRWTSAITRLPRPEDEDNGGGNTAGAAAARQQFARGTFEEEEFEETGGEADQDDYYSRGSGGGGSSPGSLPGSLVRGNSRAWTGRGSARGAAAAAAATSAARPPFVSRPAASFSGQQPQGRGGAGAGVLGGPQGVAQLQREVDMELESMTQSATSFASGSSSHASRNTRGNGGIGPVAATAQFRRGEQWFESGGGGGGGGGGSGSGSGGARRRTNRAAGRGGDGGDDTAALFASAAVRTGPGASDHAAISQSPKRSSFGGGVGADGAMSASSRPPWGLDTDKIEEQVRSLLLTVSKLKSRNESLKERARKSEQAAIVAREELDDVKEEAAHAAASSAWVNSLTKAGGANGGIAKEHEEKKRKRDEERRKLLSGMAYEDDDDAALDGLRGGRGGFGLCRHLARRFRRCTRRHTPLNRDVQKVGLRFGRSVASYFGFFQFLFVNSAWVSLIYMVQVGVHLVTLASTGTVQQYNASDGQTLTSAPISWGSFEGFIPEWLLFSAYGTSERVLYSACLVVSSLFLVITTAMRLVGEHRKSTLSAEQEGKMKHGKLALNVWDFRFHQPDDVAELKVSIANQVAVLLAEDDLLARLKMRTFKAKLKLTIRRSICLFLFLCLQGASAVAIIYFTMEASNIQKLMREVVGAIPVDLVPIAVSVINGILPPFIKILVKQMKWDSEGAYVKVLVTLIYIAKTFNAILQVTAFLLLADPVMLTQPSDSIFGVPGYVFRSRDFMASYVELQWLPATSSGSGNSSTTTTTTTATSSEVATDVLVEPNPATFNKCRGNQVGSQLFTLVLTEFVMHKLFGLLFPAINWLKAKVKKTERKKSEFNVALKTISLLYFIQLCLFSVPLLPVGAIFIPVLLWINFKWERLILVLAQSKPKKAWRAKDAGAFFVRFYLISCTIGFVFAHTVLTTHTMPKLCDMQVESMPAFYTDLSDSDLEFSDLHCHLVTQNATLEGLSYAQFQAEFAGGKSMKRAFCACRFACGPFVQDSNAYESVYEVLISVPALGIIMTGFVENVTVLWFVILFAYLLYSFRGNTIVAGNDERDEAELQFTLQVQAMHRKDRGLQKKLTLLQEQLRLKEESFHELERELSRTRAS